MSPASLRGVACRRERQAGPEWADLEWSEHLSERKHLYLLKHPETKRGGPGRGKKTGAESAPVSFSADAAVKTGRSDRSVQVDTQIAERIPEDVHGAIRDTPLAIGQTPGPPVGPMRPRGF